MHAIRRNLDLKIVLFNNRIYGLTKGQYSPTSRLGKKTKSTPDGRDRQPAPAAVASPSAAKPPSSPARSTSTSSTWATSSKRAAEHKGTAFVEIYQNCNVFNDGASGLRRPRASRERHACSSWSTASR